MNYPPKGCGVQSEWRSELRLRFADLARPVIANLDLPKFDGG